MGSILDNVKEILSRVERAACLSGRRFEDITVIAASKMNDAARVREAFSAGIRAFGENRVQEMERKLSENAYEGAELHFIGHLQRNKVKNVVGRANLIQSVDSEELISRIGKRACGLGIVQDVLLEVNIGGEEAKSGVSPEKLGELCATASKIEGVCVKGLMTIPPISVNAADSMRYFERMYNLFVDISAKKYNNINMKFLSMGMSSDFEEAILAGANIVRIGTAVFGRRDYV